MNKFIRPTLTIEILLQRLVSYERGLRGAETNEPISLMGG